MKIISNQKCSSQSQGQSHAGHCCCSSLLPLTNATCHTNGGHWLWLLMSLIWSVCQSWKMVPQMGSPQQFVSTRWDNETTNAQTQIRNHNNDYSIVCAFVDTDVNMICCSQILTYEYIIYLNMENVWILLWIMSWECVILALNSVSYSLLILPASLVFLMFCL